MLAKVFGSAANDLRMAMPSINARSAIHKISLETKGENKLSGESVLSQPSKLSAFIGVDGIVDGSGMGSSEGELVTKYRVRDIPMISANEVLISAMPMSLSPALHVVRICMRATSTEINKKGPAIMRTHCNIVFAAFVSICSSPWGNIRPSAKPATTASTI